MANKAKPTDTTGRMREEAQAKFAQELQDKAEAAAVADAEAKIKLENEVIDATVPNRATVIVDEPTVITGKKDGEETIVIRVVEDIENMTFGAGNYYSFKAGQKYEVSVKLARRLQSLGYLANTL